MCMVFHKSCWKQLAAAYLGIRKDGVDVVVGHSGKRFLI